MVVVVNAVKKEAAAVYGRVVQGFFHFIGTTPHPSSCCFLPKVLKEVSVYYHHIFL